jgi:hypothetical protein
MKNWFQNLLSPNSTCTAYTMGVPVPPVNDILFVSTPVVGLPTLKAVDPRRLKAPGFNP